MLFRGDLFRLIDSGNVELLERQFERRRILKRRFHRNLVADRNGTTLLIHAIRLGQTHCALVCLQYLRDYINVLEHRKLNEYENRWFRPGDFNSGRTALDIAIKYHNKIMVYELMKAGAKCAIQYIQGPIYYDYGQYARHLPIKLPLIDHSRFYPLDLSCPWVYLTDDALAALLRGDWISTKWSPILHNKTPYCFQWEVKTFLLTNWRLKLMSRDLLPFVFEHLLELHRRSYLIELITQLRNEKQRKNNFY